MVPLFARLSISLFVAASFAHAQNQTQSVPPGQAKDPAAKIRPDLGPSSPERRQRRLTTRYFSVELPDGWRTLTHDEGRQLRPQMPSDMRPIVPGEQEVYGPVDRWLAEGYDGRALLVRVMAANIAADDTLVQRIRTAAAQPIAGSGIRREVLTAEVAGLGEDDHPAVACRILTHVSGSGKNYEALEYYAPTGSKMLILSFRSWENDFPLAHVAFQEIASTLTFVLPSRTPKQLSDKLVMAIICGCLLGLVFLALSKSRSQSSQ